MNVVEVVKCLYSAIWHGEESIFFPLCIDHLHDQLAKAGARIQFKNATEAARWLVKCQRDRKYWVSPHPLFDLDYYLEAHPDLVALDYNPYFHFVKFGFRESRRPVPFISPMLILSRVSPSLRADTTFALRYILTDGVFLHAPCPEWSTRDLEWIAQHFGSGELGTGILEFWKSKAFSDYMILSGSKSVLISPFLESALLHSSLFNTEHYLSELEKRGLSLQGLQPLTHFLCVSQNSDISPNPYFDPKYYRERYGADLVNRSNCFVHYVLEGCQRFFRPNAWFDPLFYAQKAGRQFNGTEALVHYIEIGHRMNLGCSSQFNNPSPIWHELPFGSCQPGASEATPLLKILRDPLVDRFVFKSLDGRSEFLNPWYLEALTKSELIDAEHYLVQVDQFEQEQLRSEAKLIEACCRHYLALGYLKGLSLNRFFDPVVYGRSSFTLSLSGLPPFLHFVIVGPYERARIHDYFDCSFYLESYPDVAGAGLNPLWHYLKFGAFEARRTWPGCRLPRADGSCIKIGDLPLWEFIRTTGAEAFVVPTQCNGLLMQAEPVEATTPAISFKALEEEFNGANMKVLVVIPVYNRLDCVVTLISSLVSSPDWKHVSTCVIADDASNAFVSKRLKEICDSEPRMVLHRNERNLGFLRNCNAVVRRFSLGHDAVVLLNSDTEMPQGWLLRLLRPLVINSNIGLVTPLATCGVNQSVALRPGQNWRECDTLLATKMPRYEDACTAIGYCLAVRSTCVNIGELFDPVFEHGYGEDTDLHYRVLAAGYRSVMCENLLVYHEGGASYDTQMPAVKKKLYEANRKVFFDRWQLVHQKAWEIYSEKAPLSEIVDEHYYLRAGQLSREIDLVFVIPSNDKAIGGVKIVFRLVEELHRFGIRCILLCENASLLPHLQRFERTMPIFGSEYLIQCIDRVNAIVGTGIGTAGTVNFLTGKYPEARKWWFVQGPEGLFGHGHEYFEFYRRLKQCDQLITISPYLHEDLAAHGLKNVCSISLGPDETIFFPRSSVKRNVRSAVFPMLDNQDKGCRFGLQVAEILHSRGFDIHFFGEGLLSSRIPAGLGIRHGFLSGMELGELFSQVGFYVDFSLFEGLGLQLLEAAFCGAVPAFSRKGAPESIFNDKQNAVILQNHIEPVAAAQIICEIANDQTQFKILSENAESVSEKRNLHRGVSEFAQLALRFLSGEESCIARNRGVGKLLNAAFLEPAAADSLDLAYD